METILQIDVPDVQQLVQKLLASGCTQKSIARRLGCSQANISDIATGKVGKDNPSYWLVRGLEMLVREIPTA
jgi:transcriptional regulator